MWGQATPLGLCDGEDEPPPQRCASKTAWHLAGEIAGEHPKVQQNARTALSVTIRRMSCLHTLIAHCCLLWKMEGSLLKDVAVNNIYMEKWKSKITIQATEMKLPNPLIQQPQYLQ